MEKYLENSYRFLNLISIQFDSIEIESEKVVLKTKIHNNIEITAEISNIDIIILKVVSKKYISSERVLFTPIEFLSPQEIHKIEDFILYN